MNARLVRDAQIGVLWEGTSNINAIDVVGRAVGRVGAHKALSSILRKKLRGATELPQPFVPRLESALERAVLFAEGVADDAQAEGQARRAASTLYHVTSAILLAAEGAHNPTDARRALISRMVLDHRLAPTDPLAPEPFESEEAIVAALLKERPVRIADACGLLAV